MKVIDFFALVVIGGIALFGYDKYKSHIAAQAELQASPIPIKVIAQTAEVEDRSWIKPRDTSPTTNSAPSSQCDGRTSCPQMHSCAEATFFIQNCPNTAMDGDHDGIPCEEQWCS